jgi:CBS-domain-containing membrane protein
MFFFAVLAVKLLEADIFFHNQNSSSYPKRMVRKGTEQHTKKEEKRMTIIVQLCSV